MYKKVTQVIGYIFHFKGIKPECLSLITDGDLLDLVNSCIGNEHDRLSAQELMEHPFLAVEPEVVLLNSNEAKNHLNMQVVFKGMDKLSVKFEYNGNCSMCFDDVVDTDTAEEVVYEMVTLYPT